MATAHALLKALDAFNETTGRWLAWLALGMAAVTAVVVLLRYGFNIGSIAAQEAVTYMHGALFMLGAAYTLKHGGHVRVDIFYRRFTRRTQAWINSLGAIVFLLPVCLFILGVSWHYVAESWAIREVSAEPGGIPAVFLLKTLMLLLPVNLVLQGIAEILRNTLVLVEGRA